MTTFYFFLEDLKVLDEMIERITKNIKEIGKRMGESCKEGAETFHDNFEYEEGERQQKMWTKQLRRLIHMREQAKIQTVITTSEKAYFGKTVTIKNLETGEKKTFTIGSYQVFAKENKKSHISYNAPLCRIIKGKEIGDEAKGMIGKKKVSFEILDIV